MQAYPLHWPVGYQRTKERIPSRFDQNMDRAQRLLREEIGRLQPGAAEGMIVSTNLRIRLDGMLYSADMDRRIDDPGVAIYFKYQGKDIAMCCDKYERVWENIYALARGVEALRSLTRWGVSDFLNRAFTGFAALPDPQQTPWHEVLGVFPGAGKKEVRNRYYELAKIHHPDNGGNSEMFDRINVAYKNALKEI